jgi:two-component system sensor histidine kinase CpxA
MKKLYWKIVLTEGVFLALILGVTFWSMGMTREDFESRRREDSAAARQLLDLALNHDLAPDVSLDRLRNIVARTFKSDARIVAPDSVEAQAGPGAIRFSQGGKTYALLIPESGHKEKHGLLSFLSHDIYAGILLVLSVTLGLLAIPFARTVTGPLGELQRDMRRFASGDLDHRTRVSSDDEVGNLARDFNNMAESIQRLVHVGKEMTAHVSHELRSPLTRIDIARQLLEERLSGKELALLDSMREEIAGMDGLIGRILQLSRLDLNTATPEPVCLAAIVDEEVRRYAASFTAGNIGVRSELPETLPAIGFKDDLFCLVDNLLGNAVKFTPHGGSIDITLERESDAALLTIRNDAGEPAVDPERLVEPFQRGATSESVPGSGLGLAIAARIVGKHGGDMKLSWRDGRFSAVVRLPQNDGKSAS